MTYGPPSTALAQRSAAQAERKGQHGAEVNETLLKNAKAESETRETEALAVSRTVALRGKGGFGVMPPVLMLQEVIVGRFKPP